MKAGAYGGALLALLVLIKPHAVAILAAAELTIAVMMLLHEKFEISRRDGLLSLISLNAGFIITLLIVHVGLFGHRDLNIFGFYTQVAGRMEKPLSFLSKALMVLIAHVVYTNIIFGLPLVVTLLGSLGLFSSNRPECRARLRVLCVFAILALIFLLAMTAKATVNFATGLGPSELRRLHGRYYDFILPMFLIAFFALRDPALARGGRRMLTLTLFVCLASVILGFVFIAPRALVYSADYPEVAWLSNPFPAVGHIFWILAALVLVYYLIVGSQPKAAYSKYLVLSLLTGSVLVSLSLYRSAGTMPADRAGATVQSLFEGVERDTGIVAGSNLWMIFRCLFQIDGNPFVLLLPSGTPIGRTQVGNGRRWLLSLDQYQIHVPSTTIVSGADFKILQMDRAGDLEFGKGKGCDGCLEGFYESESWGAWSRESRVTIDLDRPIHGDLVLHLRGIAYGPNVGRPLNLEVGKIRTTLRFARDPTTVDAPLHLAEPADRLVISGLQPTSPASLGESSDERHLGVGLIALTIVDSTRQ